MAILAAIVFWKVNTNSCEHSGHCQCAGEVSLATTLDVPLALATDVLDEDGRVLATIVVVDFALLGVVGLLINS